MRLSAIVFVLALLGACTSMRWDPARHHVAVESATSGNVEISQVFLRKKGSGVVLYGELSPRYLTQEVPAGRVHVLLISSDGTSLYEESVPFYRIGKLFKDQQRYSFSAAIPVVPPEGGAVHLQFEGGR